MQLKRDFIHYFPFTFALFPLFVVLLSSVPGYVYVEQMFFFLLFGLSLLFGVIVSRTKEHDKVLNRVFFSVLLLTLLVLVQSTGWFFSPFLFVLYLSAIGIALLYSITTAAVFLMGLCLLFIPSVDSVAPLNDVVRILALFTAVPLSIHFSSEFLRLKQAAKKILILQDERDLYESELDRLKKNSLVWNDVLLRQSLATTRNYALYWENHSDKLPLKLRRDLGRMAKKLDEMQRDIKQFEEQHLDESFQWAKKKEK